MNRIIHRLFIPLEFPGGVAPGSHRDGNHALLARNGRGVPVLRGSAIAGVLRSAWTKRFAATSPHAADRWFGSSRGSRESTTSPLHVFDSPLEGAVADRTHNAINRHTGSVLRGALFSLEATSVNTSADMVLVLGSEEDDPASRTFLSQIIGCLEEGLTFGGHAARGIGLARIRGGHAAVRHRTFDLQKPQDHGAWLDEQQQLARGAAKNEVMTGSSIAPMASEQVLRIEASFYIPAGQDFVVGGGDALDHIVEPQRCVDHRGRRMLRLPGSAVKGIFRGWFNRLAAREGRPIADAQRKVTELKGDQVGWAFAASEEDRERLKKDPSQIECPVTRLFGSLYAKGRLTVFDAFTEEKPGQLSTRNHVSIDRISGGASDGFLFSSQVATAGEHAWVFSTRIHVDTPSDDEVRWLAMTLQAINLGLLRIGSSKAAGRLELLGTPAATGPLSGDFKKHFEKIGGSRA